jgi:hypothetical protein
MKKTLKTITGFTHSQWFKADFETKGSRVEISKIEKSEYYPEKTTARRMLLDLLSRFSSTHFNFKIESAAEGERFIDFMKEEISEMEEKIQDYEFILKLAKAKSAAILEE